MNKLFFLFAFFSFAVSVFALENDSLLKKQKVKFYFGVGINSNLPTNENFHYYYNTTDDKDGVIQDYDISVSRVYSPLLTIGIGKVILSRGKFCIDLGINDMILLIDEKYKIKGTHKYPTTGLVQALEGNISTQLISNYFSSNVSFLYNSSPNRLGFFLGSGFYDMIHYKSKSELEVTDLTFNQGKEKVSGANTYFNNNLKFSFATTFGLEIHYKIKKINLKSQLFSLLQVSKNGTYSYLDSHFNKQNYLIFFSTAFKI